MLNKTQSSLKPLLKGYLVETIILLLGLGAMNAIFISRVFRQSTTINPEGAAQFGSFVGGYIGAFFALTGVVLLFSTLKAQRLATLQQNFETKYFELIKMQRDNVGEIEIQGAKGRKVFVLMIREFRSALDIVRKIAAKFEEKLSQKQLFHIAYYCMFFGVGPNSSRMLKLSLAEFDGGFIDAVEKTLNSTDIKAETQRDRNFDFVPFEGHQSRLGHYYRHLYQMIRYVDQQTIEIDKYEYVKTIRAQLSTHEQALLLINSLTPMGQNWWLNDLIAKYRMVQNIPREFFDSATELDLTTMFGPSYFEWQEPRPGTLVDRSSAA